MDNNKMSISEGEPPRRTVAVVPKTAGCLEKRTRLEKILFVLLVVIIICLVGVSLALAFVKTAAGTCVKPECIEISSDLLASIDTTVNPCHDFYNYTCAKWIRKTAHSDRFSKLENDMDSKLKALLEEDDHVPHHFQKARLFYKSCMDKDKRETESVHEFLQDIESFGGYPAVEHNNWNSANFNFLEALRYMNKKGAPKGVFITVETGFDYRNNRKPIISVSQTVLGLPSKDFYKDDEIMDKYLDLVAQEALYLCRNSDQCYERPLQDVKQELKLAVAVERNLADMQVAEEELDNPELVNNVMELNDLQDKAEGLNWMSVIQVYFPEVTQSTQMMVKVPKYMDEFAQYVGHLTKTLDGRRQLANYLSYRHVLEVAPHLDQALMDLNDKFFSTVFDDRESRQPWEECVQLSRSFFGFSLAAMYAKNHFPKSRKTALEKTITDLRQEVKEILKETSWMDSDTRNEALSKLESLHVIAGYPDDMLDEFKLNSWYAQLVVGDRHYQNYKMATVFIQELFLDAYQKKRVDKSSWLYIPSSIFDATIFYNNYNNTIVVPLGISQEGFIDEDIPKYVNYGRIGFLVAQELGHAFDSTGSNFDGRGNWRKWWKNDTMKKFKQSSKCMVDMFDGYFVPNVRKRINGTLTLTENIADDLGITVAFKAYKKAAYREPDSSLPGLDLNPEQLFWVNMASVWCESKSDEFYKNLVEVGPNSPTRFRVTSTLSNSEDFATDFSCPQGSKMSVKSKCHVWGA